MIALNILGYKGKGSILRERDAAAARRIAQEIARIPGTGVFVLYGELHLGRTHLPRDLRAALERQTKLVTIHQNNTDLYWKSPTMADGQRPEVLQLAAGEYCILNSVPWVKLRSYLDWLEGSPSPDVAGEEIDVLGMVHHYARLLAEAADITMRIDDAVEIFPPDRIGARRLPFGPAQLMSPDRELASHSLAFHRTGYLPRRGFLFLPTVSTNSMSEAATHLLRHSLRSAPPPRARWGADEWISHFMLGYLGSKILNPKRKCNEVADLKRLAEPGRGAGEIVKVRAEIAGRALALLAPHLKGDRITRRQKKRLPGPREIEACRTAGFVLGERFFLALLVRPSLLEHLRRMLSGGEGRALLKDAAARIGEARVASASKQDKF